MAAIYKLQVRMYIWGMYVHMCTKYKVSMCNPVPGEVCTDDANTDANMMDKA